MTQIPTRHEPANPLHDTPVAAAIRRHDKAQRHLDAVWGIDVVEELVSPLTAARWAKVKQLRDEALLADDEDRIIATLDGCVRGMKAMHEEALAAGCKPRDVRSIEFRDEKGRRYLFVADEADARAAAKSDRHDGWQIWSFAEIARMIHSNAFARLAIVKHAFSDATVTKVGKAKKTMQDDPLNDDLPSNMF